MARRTALPPHIRKELTFRARAGAGLDFEFPTDVGGRVVPAGEACGVSPSEFMTAMAQDVVDYLFQAGARHVEVVTGLRLLGQPGGMTVRWFGPVRAVSVAAKFAVSHKDGLPRVPAWLCLRCDDDFDMRWQPPY